jgi:hypothetical protein
MEKNCWFPLHDNAPAHRSVLAKDFFLAKNNVTTVEHSPHSPDLTPSDFYLSPSIEISIKRRRYCDATITI